MEIIILLIVIAIILVVAYFWIGNYFYNFALNAKKEKEFITDNPHLAKSEAILEEVAEAAKHSDKRFREQVPISSLSVISHDKLKLKLHANLYHQEEQNQKWAIVVHGYGSKAADMVRWVRGFYEKGYNVLVPDLRGHGKSEGNYIGMGWHDRLDLLLWIDEVLAINPDADIALYGISMGGATVMMTSGEDLPPNVKVIVEDCGYSSVDEIFAYQLKDLFKLPKFPVINAASTVAKRKAGFDLYKASAIEKVSQCKVPMLFIHGKEDSFVPFEMLDKVYNAANVEKERLIIPNAGHGESVQVDPELYWTTIWRFVDRYID
ncbi:alpha/beta hydrolase [Gracilibacillus oryzae]|uniref:Alpha/beta hydrolase n=1 Tax=Gracilibacillus oryzae TaxID=1672701 RepID=A0A7C8L7S5_9BACI|nr:alpha/beta hydrolase [Gracilibacillus oryzae]KAB8137684.1 alpha/beta hydrolase [Gracilibacillus oryzae]